jgi:xanthine phosphoribosyltransferase
VFSYTYKKKFTYIVSQEWLSANDHVLIIDDFMAKGNAMQGLVDLVSAAGATLEGIGVAVEKGFQGGGDLFRHLGVPYKALAVIDRVEGTELFFREDD